MLTGAGVGGGAALVVPGFIETTVAYVAQRQTWRLDCAALPWGQTVPPGAQPRYRDRRSSRPIWKMRFLPARLADRRASSARLRSSSRVVASQGYVASPPLMVKRAACPSPSEVRS